jgi:hypothetical protein
MVIKRPRSRKIKPEENSDKNIYYCRKCGLIKREADFFNTNDFFLDAANKKLSICKSCCNEIFNNFMINDKDIKKTIYRMCKLLNIMFDETAVASTINYIESSKNKGKEVEGVFGIYKKNLRLANMPDSVNNSGGDENLGDMTFSEPKEKVMYDPIKDDEEHAEYLKYFWGEKFNYDEYVFLEKELAEWKSSYSCSTKAEEFYMKEICLKQLELRNARIEKGNSGIAAIQKSMDTLLKAAALTPAQATAASSSKMIETIGMKIKMIETTTPAEYYKGENKDLFKDYDNIGQYFYNYVYRPVSNFFSGNKNFELLENSDMELEIKNLDKD